MLRQVFGGRPSPAVFISIAALLFAMAGAATALPGKNNIDANDLQRNVVRSKHIKNKQVKPGDLAAGVAVAKAYGYVNADGTVDETRSKGLADANVVIDPGSGIYGLRGLGFSPRLVLTGYAFQGAGATGNNAAGGPRAFIGDCSFVDGTDQACVATNTDDDPSSEADDFFVVIY